ncbi:MAG: hypothetical protein PHN57_07675 [Candidatus Omnitrophica bacterium]|nr:hypothetical protein [Candidatus Omnitrophota bacterium]
MKTKFKLLMVLAVLFLFLANGKAFAQFAHPEHMNPAFKGEGRHFGGSVSAPRSGNFSGSVRPSVKESMGSNTAINNSMSGGNWHNLGNVSNNRHFDRRIDRDHDFDRDRHHHRFVIFGYPYYYNPDYYYPGYYNEPLYSGYLSIADIADMASRGVPDDEIINEIARTGTRFSLSSADVDYLRAHGVSERVIDYILSSANSASMGY